jgi:hypothetical protein
MEFSFSFIQLTAEQDGEASEFVYGIASVRNLTATLAEVSRRLPRSVQAISAAVPQSGHDHFLSSIRQSSYRMLTFYILSAS